jgi:hypothetical protein
MKVVIAETRSSTWSYHLRELKDDEEPKLSGLPFGTKALCGNENLGWDTKIPQEAWGMTGHLNEKWCSECARLYHASVMQLMEGKIDAANQE